MKSTIYLLSIFLCVALFTLITSCSNDDDNNLDLVTSPFNNGSIQRNKIVVVSDLHMGADLAYSEINKNLKPLAHLLNEIRTSSNVKELVIAGDLLDEWFVPANVDTYKGGTQRDFVLKIAETNKIVFDVLNNIINEKNILVTYVPGNHDLTITEANVELVLPGINQAREEVLGLGAYSPVDFPELAIEHGHRYNFFCAPDPYSNQDIAPGTILPPGYFYTRIAALCVDQGNTIGSGVIEPIGPNETESESQRLLYNYGKLWEHVVKTFPINESLGTKVIKTNIDGFTGDFSIQDLVPTQSVEGGYIDVNLYKGIQDNWDKRQKLCNITVNIPVGHAIANAESHLEVDNLAQSQYFFNTNSEINSSRRIVVFGHNHRAKLTPSRNYKGEHTIYANSGTWIDHQPVSSGPGQTFVVITPSNEKTSKTYVRLFNFINEVYNQMGEDSLTL